MKLSEAVHIAKLIREYKVTLITLLKEGKSLPPLTLSVDRREEPAKK